MKWFLVLCSVVFLTELGDGIKQPRRPLETSLSLRYLTKPNQDIHVHIMVHLDPTLTKKLAKLNNLRNRKSLKRITDSILKEVETFFHHPSLNQTIRFKIIDTRFLRNRSKVLMDENATKYLKSYCEWQSKKKRIRKKLFYSVLLTGLDLFYLNSQGQKVWRSTGRGYMGGICNIKKSCTLLEWHPKNTGYLLAHEIAHSLGINHDGPPLNHCKGNHVMSTRYNPQSHPKTWSPCSQHALRRYLKSSRSWCIKTENNNISFGYH